MKILRRMAGTVGIAATLTLAGATGATAAPPTAPDPGDPPPPHTATCASGTTTVDWTNKNPADCHRGYVMYSTSGEVLLHFSGGGDTQAMQESYAAAQEWCAENTLSCNVLTGLGFMIAAPLYAQATS